MTGKTTIRKREPKTQSTRLYFAYGSNLSLMQMLDRCPDSEACQRLSIKDWRLCFKRVADMEAAEGATIHGALYRITARCEKSLDRFEGWRPDGSGAYRKVDFAVTLPSGDQVDAFFYKKNGEALSPPTEHYYDIIAQGYREWGLPLKALKAARAEAREAMGELLRPAEARIYEPAGPWKM